MRNKRWIDYKIRPKGSCEVAYDPFLIMTMRDEKMRDHDPERAKRASRTFNFIIKIALKILPPKQREIFYSVWVRSGGKMSKGVMEFSRKNGKSHYTAYNNLYKAMSNLRIFLDRSGYGDQLIKYILGKSDNID